MAERDISDVVREHRLQGGKCRCGWEPKLVHVRREHERHVYQMIEETRK